MPDKSKIESNKENMLTEAQFDDLKDNVLITRHEMVTLYPY